MLPIFTRSVALIALLDKALGAIAEYLGQIEGILVIFWKSAILGIKEFL